MTELSKKSQNPLSELASAPFENNFGWGAGPDEQASFILNFEPAIPAQLDEVWSVTHRVIFPVIDQPFGIGHREWGLGDINYTVYFSPTKRSSIWSWGVGPVIQVPTSTNEVLGTKKWAVGPSWTGVYAFGPWVMGALLSQIWSVAGDDSRPSVSQLTLQPFIHYNFADGWAVSTAPLVTANWNEPHSQIWTIPLGAGVAKTAWIGSLPISFGAQFYQNVEAPQSAPDSVLRATVSFLFPK